MFLLMQIVFQKKLLLMNSSKRNFTGFEVLSKDRPTWFVMSEEKSRLPFPLGKASQPILLEVSMQ